MQRFKLKTQVNLMVKNHSEPNTGNAKILITGGSGFLGRTLLLKLTQQQIPVVVYSRKPPAISKSPDNNEGLVTWRSGDIANKEEFTQAAHDIDIIIHLAAAMTGDWPTHQATTIDGTQNVLDLCQANPIKKFIYVSTLNVYDAGGYHENLLVDEQYDYEPQPEKRGFYSAAKLAAEHLILQYAKEHPEADITLFRPGLIYGPGLDPLLKDLGKNLVDRFILCPGNGQRKLPLVYVEDVAAAINTAIHQRQTGLHMYNLVDSTYPTQSEYLAVYNQQTGKQLKLVPIPFWCLKIGFKLLDCLFEKLLKKPKNLSYRLSAISNTPTFSISKAEKELNWKPNITVKAAIHNMLQWQRESDQT